MKIVHKNSVRMYENRKKKMLKELGINVNQNEKGTKQQQQQKVQCVMGLMNDKLKQ